MNMNRTNFRKALLEALSVKKDKVVKMVVEKDWLDHLRYKDPDELFGMDVSIVSLNGFITSFGNVKFKEKATPKDFYAKLKAFIEDKSKNHDAFLIKVVGSLPNCKVTLLKIDTNKLSENQLKENGIYGIFFVEKGFENSYIKLNQEMLEDYINGEGSYSFYLYEVDADNVKETPEEYFDWNSTYVYREHRDDASELAYNYSGGANVDYVEMPNGKLVKV